MKPIKVILVVLLTLSMVFSSLSAFGGSTTVEAKKRKMLIKKGVLTVGVEIGYPPFEQFKKDGKTETGYDIDTMRGVAKKLGLKVRFINTAFDGILKGIGKSYDVVCSAMTITKERKKHNLFSIPYCYIYQTVVVRKNSNIKINSYSDLDGLKIGLQYGTTSDMILNGLKKEKKLKNVKFIKSEWVDNCFTKLKKGKVDAVLVDSSVAAYKVKKNKGFKIAWFSKKNPEKLGITIGKRNTKLKKKIDKALKKMKKKGFFKKLNARWFPGIK